MISTSFPSGAELREQLPISSDQREFILESRQACREILKEKDDRHILIVGPCSIHDEYSTYEYADRLADLAHDVSETFFIIMRTYFEKPRTKKGWKGLIYDPTLDGLNDIHAGIKLTRKILLHLAERKIAVGCEFLELLTYHYYADLITWGCIGARTCMSQPHRQLASLLPFPMGFKNSTDGNIDNALNGIISASLSHTFLGVNIEGRVDEIRSMGNPFCHLVLRGGIERPNFASEIVKSSVKKSTEYGLIKKILVDCSHDNSGKNAHLQSRVFKSVIDQIVNGNEGILGMMIESHLEAGNQILNFPLRYGVSVTDACLGWESTRALILEAAYQLEASKKLY